MRKVRDVVCRSFLLHRASLKVEVNVRKIKPVMCWSLASHKVDLCAGLGA